MVDAKRAPVTRAQRWIRGAILVIGAVTILCFAALSPILRRIVRMDRSGSVPRTAIAVVEQIVPPHIEENVKPTPAQVWVRIEGQIAPAETVFGSSLLKVGGRAQIVYRIGRSGRIYVDRVEPMPNTHAAPAPSS